MFEAFTATEIQAGEDTSIFVRTSGSGQPVLLLHGFPQTHLMWRSVAPLLAQDFFVVCADLRGYGRSSCPGSASDHAPYSKRSMARDMVIAMEQLGFSQFSVAGHDRGGRVAYRLALDYPDRVERLWRWRSATARCSTLGALATGLRPAHQKRAEEGELSQTIEQSRTEGNSIMGMSSPPSKRPSCRPRPSGMTAARPWRRRPPSSRRRPIWVAWRLWERSNIKAEIS